MPTNLFTTAKNPADLAIVGLGIGGLVAALEAATIGMKIVVFTDRLNYTRGQRLGLTDENKTWLATFNTTNQNKKAYAIFVAKMLANNGYVQTKDLERFLLQQLKQLASDSVTIVQLDKKNGHEIQSIQPTMDKQSDCIMTSDQTQYYFKNLIAADGAHHSTATKVNQGILTPETQIKYQDCAQQEQDLYHASVQMRMKKNIVQNTQHDQVLRKSVKEYAKEYGWDKLYEPSCIVLSGGSKHNILYNKFSVTGAIPENIHFETNSTKKKEFLTNWAIYNIAKIYPNIDLNELELNTTTTPEKFGKNALVAISFTLKRVRCENPIADISNGQCIQIGDANATPNYRLTHGANDAFTQGIHAVKYLHKYPQLTEDEAILAKSNFLALLDENAKSLDQLTILSRENQTTSIAVIIKKITQLVQDLSVSLPQAEHEAMIQELKSALDILKTTGSLQSMYDALNKIRPVAIQHQNTGLIFRAYRGILSMFGYNTLPKSAPILDELQTIADHPDRLMKQQFKELFIQYLIDYIERNIDDKVSHDIENPSDMDGCFTIEENIQAALFLIKKFGIVFDVQNKYSEPVISACKNYASDATNDDTMLQVLHAILQDQKGHLAYIINRTLHDNEGVLQGKDQTIQGLFSLFDNKQDEPAVIANFQDMKERLTTQQFAQTASSKLVPNTTMK